MKNTICKNCGGDYGLHHYETLQCPVGGCEAPNRCKQEWMQTTFEEENNEVEELRNTVNKLIARLEVLENQVQKADQEIQKLIAEKASHSHCSTRDINEISK